MAKNDGGPAFPVTLEQLECDATGMTRRQWYAGLLAAGDWANPETWESANDTDDEELRDAARVCWRMADALLATENEDAD